ncbi:MAG: lamin tail domain-containing protein, partial [Clostridiales bacterium]|jgi:hypothetical protein|nr:lamin tail domain-containing protein [Clostridiales bacterium]
MLEGDTDIKAVFIRDEDYFKSKGSLVINEVMYSSNNASGHDWIELYNSSEKEIILNDYFLSDTLDHPYKWQFPKYILYPGQFFLVNCTGQDIVSIPDNYQTKFKLKEGETVILSYFDDIIDTFYIDKSVDNCQTEEAYSMGRYPDGSGNYLLLSVPTPEEANVVFDYNMYVHPSINDKVMVNGVIKSGLSVAVIDGNLYIDDNSENLIPVEDYATSLNRDYFYVSSINAIAFFKKS